MGFVWQYSVLDNQYFTYDLLLIPMYLVNI